MRSERYARHSLIDWFDQDLVQQQKVVVVGAGAVGNEVIKNLALLGVGHIQVFDKDVIELHNLTRSVLFRETDVGQPKAVCAAARAREIEPAATAIAHVGDFWDTLGLSDLAKANVVFSCVDNFEARIRLSRLAAIAGTPLVNIGIDSRHAVVETFAFDCGTPVPCYECALPLAAYATIARRYSCGWLKRVALVEKKIPTTVLTSSAAASLAVSVYLRRLTGEVPAQSWRYFQDTFTGQTTRTEIGVRPGCPGCSDLLAQRIIVRAGRLIGTRLTGVLPAAGIGRVSFSDRVLTHAHCRDCDGSADGIEFTRADRFDENFAQCPRCGSRREVGIRDDFDATELLGRFAGRRLPGKFIYTCVNDDLQVFIELEGADDGRGEGDSQDSGPYAQGGSDVAAQSDG